jgi:hypothetical protein
VVIETDSGQAATERHVVIETDSGQAATERHVVIETDKLEKFNTFSCNVSLMSFFE